MNVLERLNELVDLWDTIDYNVSLREYMMMSKEELASLLEGHMNEEEARVCLERIYEREATL
jgi:hypothetical protein